MADRGDHWGYLAPADTLSLYDLAGEIVAPTLASLFGLFWLGQQGRVENGRKCKNRRLGFEMAVTENTEIPLMPGRTKAQG